MKKNLTSFILFLISLSYCPVFAQSNYKLGYIVKITGDTVKGYVDNRSDFRNARFINFKTDVANEAVKYEPKELVSYYVTPNTYYFSKDIQVYIGDKIISRTIFLEALEQGKASLYYFKQPTGEEQFYIEKDTVFKRMESKTSTITNEDGRTYLSTDKKYMRFINSIFKDCPSWKANTDFEFEENALRRAVRRYNNCFIIASDISNKIDTTITPKEKVKVGYIVQAGLNYSTVTQNGNPPPNTEIQNPAGQFGFTGGVALDITFPRVNNKLSLQLELNYSQKGVSSKDAYIVPTSIDYFTNYPNIITNPGYSEQTTAKYNMSFLDLAVMGKYTYPKGKFRPYAGLGPFMGYLINKNNAFKSTIESSTNPTSGQLPVTTNSSMYDVSLSLEIGVCAEIGFIVPVSKSNKMVFSLRYERSWLQTNGLLNPLSYYITYSPIINSSAMNTNIIYYPNNSLVVEQFQFKIGYRFH